jgi:hypothetical protein
MADAPQYVSLEDVQKLVDDQLAKVREEHDSALAAQKADNDARVDQLQAALEAAQRSGQPTSVVPEHGAGPGLEIAETWGQYQQGLAAAGQSA